MKTFTIIIETPKGSQAKYNYNEETRHFTLKKILPAGMAFPFDFGFITGTMGEDNAPLDVVIIAEFSSFTGCVMECSIVGAIQARQKEKGGKFIRNDRFIGIPSASVYYSNIKSARQLPHQLMQQLEFFFISYNKAEGKQFEVLKKINAVKACSLITKNLKKRN